MKPHEWVQESEWRSALGGPTSVRWRCHRCGWGTTLYKGFDPHKDHEVVAAGQDCDVALVMKIHMD
jgi:hypothetical protein